MAFNKKSERDWLGKTAKRAVTNSDNTIYSIKRLIGRNYEEDTGEIERKMLSYHAPARRSRAHPGDE